MLPRVGGCFIAATSMRGMTIPDLPHCGRHPRLIGAEPFPFGWEELAKEEKRVRPPRSDHPKPARLERE